MYTLGRSPIRDEQPFTLIHTGTGKTFKLWRERPQSAAWFKPRNLLLWANSTIHHTTMPQGTTFNVNAVSERMDKINLKKCKGEAHIRWVVKGLRKWSITEISTAKNYKLLLDVHQFHWSLFIYSTTRLKRHSIRKFWLSLDRLIYGKLGPKQHLQKGRQALIKY